METEKFKLRHAGGKLGKFESDTIRRNCRMELKYLTPADKVLYRYSAFNSIYERPLQFSFSFT